MLNVTSCCSNQATYGKGSCRFLNFVQHSNIVISKWPSTHRGSASPTTSPVVLLTPAAALVAPSARPTGGATNNDPKEATWETTWNSNRWPVKRWNQTSYTFQRKTLPWNILKPVKLLVVNRANWSGTLWMKLRCRQASSNCISRIYLGFGSILNDSPSSLPFAHSNLQPGGSKPPQGTWMNWLTNLVSKFNCPMLALSTTHKARTAW